jgi:hypothetical protein
MSVMKWATDLKDYLGLPIDDGHLFDTWAWEQRILEACNVNGIEEWKRYSEIHTAILDVKVFESSRGSTTPSRQSTWRSDSTNQTGPRHKSSMRLRN